MKTCTLPVIVLLVAGVAGCGEEPQPAADGPYPKTAEPDERQKAAIAESEELKGRVSLDRTSPDRPVTPTRDQAVGVLRDIQSVIEAGVVWRHERADGKRLLSEIHSALEAGEQHSRDFEAEVNVLKHFHRAPEWDGKRFKGQVRSLFEKRAFLPPVIQELSEDGAWGRADELFDKARLRRRVALHEVKADDCYALVLENGKAEAILHWNGERLTILHYSEPAVRESLDKFVMDMVRETQSEDGSARALSHYHLRNLGPHAEGAIAAISQSLPHDINAAVTLWKIDRRSSVSVPPLVDALADTSLPARHRAMAADGLGIIGPPARDAKATLHAAMGEKQSKLRVSAAWAFWKTTGDSKSTRPVLLELLEDGDLNVFFAAAKTLGEMGWDKKSLAALVVALQANPRRAFASRRLTQTLVEALASDDAGTRKEAIVALSKIGGPETLVRDALTKALEDKNPEVRVQAAEALKNYRSEYAEPVVQ